MQLLIYSGLEPRKPLVATAEVQWEGATLCTGIIELKSDQCTNELVYRCVGAAYQSHWGVKNPPKDNGVNETTFCRLVNNP